MRQFRADYSISVGVMEAVGTSLRTLAGIALVAAMAFVIVYLTRVILGLDESSALVLITLLLLLPSAVTRLFARRT